MREKFKKLISIFIIMLMLINSSLLTLISTAIDAIETAIEDGRVNVIESVSIEKYVNYNFEEKKGVLLKFNAQSGIEYKDEGEYQPLKSTTIGINAPKINGEFPEEVQVNAIQTMATNGGNKDFEYSYNKEKGILVIHTENVEDKDGKIYSEYNKEAKDIYEINLYYGDNCYDGENKEKTLEIKTKVLEKIANNNETTLTKDGEYNFDVKENISGLVSNNIVTADIYNGYINSNIQNGTNNETVYEEYMNLEMDYKEIADEIQFKTLNKFVNNKNEEIDTNDIIYKSSELNKNNIIDILGEQGYLQILNQAGKVILQIDNNTEAKEDGTIKIDYEEEVNDLIIKTSKPLKIGKINIKNIKAIKSTMKNLENNKIKVEGTVNCTKNVIFTEEKEKVESKQTYNYLYENVIEMKNSQTKIDLDIDKKEWTSNTQNEINFTAKLIANNVKYNLFKNPIIDIKLPEEVEKVVLGNVSLLNNNKLEILKSEIINEKNNKIIRITLVGTQNEYNSSAMFDGTEILIPATIILKKDINNCDSNVEITYSNESGIVNDYIADKNESKKVDVKLVNPMSIENTTQPMSVENQGEPTSTENDIDYSKVSLTVTPNVGGSTLKDGDTVYEQEVIAYSVCVKNNTGKDLSNLKLSANIPEGTTYIEKEDGSWIYSDTGHCIARNPLFTLNEEVTSVSKTIENLKAEEEYSYEVKVRVNDIGDLDSKDIILNANLTHNDTNILDQTVKLKANDAKLKVEVYPNETEFDIVSNYTTVYTVEVTNLTDENIEKSYIEIKLADEYNFRSIKNEFDYDYDENTRILKVYIDNIQASGSIQVYIKVSIDNFKENKYEYITGLYVSSVIDGDNEEYRSNYQSITVERPHISITQTSATEGEDLKADQTIEYNLKVENLGKQYALINIMDDLPKGLIPLEAEYDAYVYNDEIKGFEKKTLTKDLRIKTDDQYDLNIQTYIHEGETLNVKITAKADILSEILEIENTATVTGNDIDTIMTNSIKNRILPYGYEENPGQIDPSEPSNPDYPGDTDDDSKDDDNKDDGEKNKYYSISGTAWIDSNRNGYRENSEKLLEGVTVKLFNSDTSTIVIDKDGNLCKTETDSEGKYSFDNLSNGNYLVLFEFDTSKYTLTQYQKSGISETSNSDVILKEANIDGKISKVGVTDVLVINNQNFTNIDVGLIENSKLDLSINMTVTKITVENNSGTTEYTYNKSKLAKVEIPSKLIANTTLTIEYTIDITNEGNEIAYATEILDNLPDVLTFDSSINNNWEKIDKNIINKSLAATKIEPGETKQVTINLTKKLNSSSIGTITNSVQLSGIYNTDGLEDINSENNTSDAQIIVSIKTGVITKIAIVIAILVFIIIMLLAIKYKKYALGISLICTSIFVISGNVDRVDAKLTENGNVIGINFDDLAGHFNTANGKWETIYGNGQYWCISPGKHLGYYNKDIKEGDSIANNYKFWAGMCSRQHMYTEKESNTYTSLGALCTYMNIKLGMLNGISATDWSVFSKYFETNNKPEPTLQKVSTTIKFKDDNSDKVIVGPFKYDAKNIDSSSLSVKKTSGESVNYTICDSNGNEKKSTSSGQEFYIKVNKNVGTVKVTITCNQSTYIEKKSVKVILYEYDGNNQNDRIKNDNTGLCIGPLEEENCTFLEKLLPKKEANGKTYHLVILAQVKDGESSDTVATHKNGYSNFEHQTLVKIVPITNTELRNTSISEYWTVTIPTGKITVTKKDKDTGKVMPGTVIQLKKGNSVILTKTTDANGQCIFEYLLPGTYTVYENGAPQGYTLNLQTERKKDVNVTSGKNELVTIYNRKYGNLVIQKQDSNYGTNIEAAGFKFEIYIMSGATKNYIKSYIAGSPATITYTTNENEAYKFSTNSQGKIQLNNIPSYPTYYVKEVEVPTALENYYNVKSSVNTVKISDNGKTATLNVKNVQIYTDITGKVWEDKADNSKGTLKNNKYDNNETLVQGVTVRLKKDNTIIAQTTTNKNGVYTFKSKGTYNNKDYTIVISELSKYSVEFEYNGLKYTNVVANTTQTATNVSRAKEKTADRTEFNNSYSTITGGKAKGTTSTTGYSRNTNGTITNNLTYKNGTYSSTLVQNTGYTVGSASGSVKAQNGSVGVVMKADTKTAEYTLACNAPDTNIVTGAKLRKVANVNLGLQEREQPDIAIASDLDSVDLKINGYSHEYMYNQRAKISNIDIFSEITKYKDNKKEYPKTYTRTIYSSYVNASGITGSGALQDKDKLEFYATYKITLKNESSSLYISANEIANYCDSKFDLNSIESWYMDSNNKKINVEWTNNGTKNGYSEIRTTSLKSAKIANGKSLTIYLKLKKKDSEVYSWASQTSSTNYKIETYNMTELTSYSSYVRSGSTYSSYAGIDKDSAPDNIMPGSVSTYEDDTDSAPVLTITFDEPRTISGYVFEDSTGTELKTKNTRNGDGKYNASDDGYVANVKVELINSETNNVAYIYPDAVSSGNFNAKVAECTTTKNGKGAYEFKGIIPGKYYIKFTYGDGSIIYKNVNGTEESTNVSIQNYKSTIITADTAKTAMTNQSTNKTLNQTWYQDNAIKSYSSAVDDYNKRTEINNKVSTINYKTETDFLNESSSMEATTPIMDIAIENKNGEKTELDQSRVRLYDNIDFGIVERARQNINMYKEISHVKLVLANGQTLVEGDPRTDNLNYVIYPKGGILYIAIDSEITEGSSLEVTYEIKVENNSELDYNTENYYKYGEIANDDKPISTTIDAIADYMDEGLVTSYKYDETSGEWYFAKATGGDTLGEISVSRDAYNKIKNNSNNLIIKNPKLNNGTSTLAPGESGTITINASKLLTATGNLQYENRAEILTLSNQVGRFNGKFDTESKVSKWEITTPGNLESGENDQDEATLSITPPTGGNVGNIVIYAVIGICCLVVLAGGIIVIKKRL